MEKLALTGAVRPIVLSNENRRSTKYCTNYSVTTPSHLIVVYVCYIKRYANDMLIRGYANDMLIRSRERIPRSPCNTY